MSLVLVTPPSIEPLSLAEAIDHLRLSDGMGLEPAPRVPIVALAGAGAGGVDNGTHRYRCTFVTADGETEGGDITELVTVADKTANGKVRLTSIPLSASARVTARRIYRTRANRNELFYRVAELTDNTTTSYTDTVADGSLGVSCPLTNTAGSPRLADAITAARLDAELYLNKALLRQTWRLLLDAFPAGDEILLKRPPLIGLAVDDSDRALVEYMDVDGNWQFVDPSLYTVDVDALPGRILLNYACVWPMTRCQRSAVRITFTCGYGDTAAAVPRNYIAGIKLLLGDLWENRETSVSGTIVTQLPAWKRCLSDRYLEAR